MSHIFFWILKKFHRSAWCLGYSAVGPSPIMMSQSMKVAVVGLGWGVGGSPGPETLLSRGWSCDVTMLRTEKYAAGPMGLPQAYTGHDDYKPPPAPPHSCHGTEPTLWQGEPGSRAGKKTEPQFNADLTASVIFNFFIFCAGDYLQMRRSYQSEQTCNPGPMSRLLIMLMVNTCKWKHSGNLISLKIVCILS